MEGFKLLSFNLSLSLSSSDDEGEEDKNKDKNKDEEIIKKEEIIEEDDIEDYLVDTRDDIFNQQTLDGFGDTTTTTTTKPINKATDKEIQLFLKNSVAEFEKDSITTTKDVEKRLDNTFFNFCKYILYFFALHIPDLPNNTDTDEELRDKALYLYLQSEYLSFKEKLESIHNDIVEHVRKDIMQRVYDDEKHPLIITFDQVLYNSELHCRRIKSDPNKIRTKMDIGEKPGTSYNVVNIEPCTFGNGPSTMKWMIFNPLPSDKDSDAVDPVMGDVDHALAIEVDKINGELDARDTELFGCVVSPTWCNLLCFIHNLVHFEQYSREHLLGPISKQDFSKYTSWPSLWKDMTVDYAEKRITRFSRNKGKPLMVIAITELRDIVRTALKFHSDIVK